MVTAYVLINCDRGSEENVIEELKHFENVKDVHGTFGAYDIVAKVEAKSRDTLRDTITENVRRLNNVRSTLTLMGIEGQEHEKEKLN